jgi:O-antigen/teichoic acid export membrane protein
MISNVLIQVLRGLGKNKEYSVSSIITGITSIAVNTLLIIKYGYKANSIFIASSISNTIVIVYVVLTTKLYKYLSIKEINKNTIKEILNYSLPMIPNSLSWWIVSVSDRTIISIILGTALNGIYTVSCKFSNILNSIFGVFNMSWQETVSVHINDQDRNEFFSKMINRLFILFSSISLLIMLALPFVYNILIGKEYLESYKYIPILLYANSWYVLSSLLGGIYIGLKQTKKIANTTIASAIINIVINILLMNKIGLYAACISTLISYLAMSIYRYIDLKKYLNIKISLRNIMISTLLFCIGYIVFFI